MAERGYSEGTVYGREGIFSDLVAWCNERGIQAPSQLSRQVLELYQKHLAHRRKEDGTRLSLITQSNILIAIRSFCGWLVRSNLLLYNPAGELVLPKRPHRIPREVLSPAEVEQVLNTPDLSTLIGIRDRALLETIYSTGVRRSEAAHLEISDIDFDRGSLLVREGKNRKDRLIPIGERALAWIRRYLDDVRPEIVVPPDEGVLFLTRLGRPFDPNGISGRVTKIFRASGIRKQGSTHLLRHTMATAMLEGGADIRYIQQMLGHESIKTTQIYTRVSIRALKEVHDATHPAAMLRPQRRRGIDLDLEDLDD
jgi:integrase/recombinase XerD